MSEIADTPNGMAEKPVAWTDILVLCLVSFGIAFLLRLVVLPLSVVDWDESLYLLVTRDLLDGKFPYQGAFEHKPVALYYAFALAQFVLGEGIVAIRLLAIAASGATAFLIGLLLRRCFGSDMVVAAGGAAIYSILSVLNGGFATNSEILLNFYAVLAMLLLVGWKLDAAVRPVIALTVGAVLSIMFNTNYLSALPIVGIGVGYIVATIGGGRFDVTIPVCLKNGLWVLAGFALSAIALLLPIAIWSDVGDYFARQYSFLSAYRSSMSALSAVSHLVAGLQAYAFLVALVCALFLFAVLGRTRSWIDPQGRGAASVQVAIYLCFTFTACVVSGRMYPHYFILMLPPLCILAGMFLAWLRVEMPTRRAMAVWLIVMAIFSLGLERTKIRTYADRSVAWLSGNPPDLPAEIARDFSTEVRPGDIIYVYDYEHILYYLLEAALPLKYVFPAHHLKSKYGLHPVQEMNAVMAKSPRLVIAGTEPSAERYGAVSRKLADVLKRRYELARVYPVGRAAVRVYRRVD